MDLIVSGFLLIVGSSALAWALDRGAQKRRVRPAEHPARPSMDLRREA